jgi:DNA-binding NarL/FixJ family response regulator
MHSDERYVVRAVKAGARGYVLKDTMEEGIIKAVYQLQKGNAFFSPEVARVFQERSESPELREVDDRYELLTDRERQIYQLLAEGKSNKEIASRLDVSVHTAETHRARIMDKLNVHGVAELVLSAVRRGLVR